jgi:hypothetical protein
MNWWARLRVVTKKEQTSRELDDELRFHIERQAAEYIAEGMTPEEARRRAAGVRRRPERPLKRAAARSGCPTM